MEEIKNTQKDNGCTGCGDCRNMCPTHAIKRRNGIYFIDPVRCMNCGMCREVCPVGGPKMMPFLF